MKPNSITVMHSTAYYTIWLPLGGGGGYDDGI